MKHLLLAPLKSFHICFREAGLVGTLLFILLMENLIGELKTLKASLFRSIIRELRDRAKLLLGLVLRNNLRFFLKLGEADMNFFSAVRMKFRISNRRMPCVKL